MSVDTTGQPASLAKFRPGVGRPRGFDANVQTIASAAHGRGVSLVHRDRIVGTVEAAELCRILRAAHENTRGQDGKHAHVEQLAGGIAVRIGARGAVEINQLAMNLLSGYARPKKNGTAGAP